MRSLISHQTIYFERNVVHSMSAVGRASKLIAIEGFASIQAKENVFYEIGYFTEGHHHKVKYPHKRPP